LYIDSIKVTCYTQDAFTHGEDRATLESDLSAPCGLAGRVVLAGTALFFTALFPENQSDKLMPPEAALWGEAL